MATGAGNVPRPRPRARQDETAPFPLELMVPRERLAPRPASRRAQDETAPFPLSVAAFPRRRRARSDEPRPVLLAADARHGSTPPGLEPSAELQRYAARLAAGEKLPPYAGPILARDERGATAPRAPGAPVSRGPRVEPVSARAASAFDAAPAAVAVPRGGGLKVALGLLLLGGLLVASATVGDDAALRAAGRSLGGWLRGGAPSEPLVPVPPAASPCPTTAR